MIRPATLALMASLALFAVGSVHAQADQGRLRIRLNADILSTDPGVNRDSNSDAVMAHIVEGLVAFRENTTVGPLLAQTIDVSPDGTRYTFHLRRGIRFSNGAALTADDVLFSWHRDMKRETGWRCRGDFEPGGAVGVRKVEAPDPMTVVYQLTKASPLFLTTLARADCGGSGVVHRTSVGADGRWIAPIGTGPFKLGEWKRNQSIELERNPLYSALPGQRDGNTGNKTAFVDKVRFVVIPDPSATRAALLTRAIDINADIDEADVAEYRSRRDVVMQKAPTMDLNGILFQTRDPLLKDPRIRRAFALALDVPEMVDAITEGLSPASRSAIPPASPYYKPAQAAMARRDVAGARRLLAEAGYHGQPIKLLTTRRYPNVFTAALLAQAMAQEAGFRIKLEVLDWATLTDHYLRGDYQMLAYSFSARLDPSLSYEMFTGPKDTEPRKAWESPEAIALLGQSMATADVAQRQAVFDQLDVALRRDVPVVWLYSKVRMSAVLPTVVGYAGWPLGQPRAWGVTLRR